MTQTREYAAQQLDRCVRAAETNAHSALEWAEALVAEHGSPLNAEPFHELNAQAARCRQEMTRARRAG